VGCDRLYAWEGGGGLTKGKTLRVEAGSLYGHPVYFKLVPSRAAVSQSASTSSTGRGGGALGPVVAALMIGVLIACLAFAQRNWRLGRGDRRGAVRLGVVIFAATAVWIFLIADHWGNGLRVYHTVLRILSWALFWGAYGSMLYLALEPYVRRAWPERIVSITRLLSGRLADPLIGRDVLIGLVIGMTADLGFMICQTIGNILGWPMGRYWGAGIASGHLSMRHTLSALSNAIGAAASTSLWILFLLMVALAVLRRRNRATVGVILCCSFWCAPGLAAGTSSAC